MNTARVRLPGQPDAACDLVAEAIVDEYVRRDPQARLKLSVMGGRGALFVAGDVISSADFDISQLIQRTVGSVGVISGIEPFVSIEPIVAERATLFGAGPESPVAVVGYATSENAERIPAPLLLAKRVAKALDEKRRGDEAWYWFGADAEVFVTIRSGAPARVSVRLEHGAMPLQDVRVEVAKLVRSIEAEVEVRVNELGPDEVRGIGNAMGASGRDPFQYGFLLPAVGVGIGLDPRQAEKGGAWLARAAAVSLVRRGAKVALVRAVYFPGDRAPTILSARDEKGKDLSAEISRDALSLDRVMAEWWRPNLCADASRWGFAGEADLPWEV